MIPTFTARVTRASLGQRFAAFEIAAHSDELAAPGKRVVDVLERVEAFLLAQDDRILTEASEDLNRACELGLDRARKAVAFSVSALAHWKAIQPPVREPDLSVLRHYVTEAEKAANSKIRRQLGFMCQGFEREVKSITSAWRVGLDKAYKGGVADELRRTGEEAYGWAVNMDFSAIWPRVVFEEVDPP